MQHPLTLPCLWSMTLQFTAHYSSVNEGLSILWNSIPPMRWSRHLQQENFLPDLYPHRCYEPCCYRKATSATSSASSWCTPGRCLLCRPAGCTEEPTSAGPTLAPGMQRYCESGTGILFRGSLQIHTRELSNRSIQPAEPTPWLPALGTVI